MPWKVLTLNLVILRVQTIKLTLESSKNSGTSSYHSHNVYDCYWITLDPYTFQTPRLLSLSLSLSPASHHDLYIHTNKSLLHIAITLLSFSTFQVLFMSFLILFAYLNLCSVFNPCYYYYDYYYCWCSRCCPWCYNCEAFTKWK